PGDRRPPPTPSRRAAGWGRRAAPARPARQRSLQTTSGGPRGGRRSRRGRSAFPPRCTRATRSSLRPLGASRQCPIPAVPATDPSVLAGPGSWYWVPADRLPAPNPPAAVESIVAAFDLPLDQLRAYRPERTEPPDFDAFWQTT